MADRAAIDVGARLAVETGLSGGVADISDVRSAERRLGMRLPDSFVGFVTTRDGVEGDLGDEYLAINPVRELVDVNRQLEAQRYMPGFVLFGSDGLGNGYGFDLRAGHQSVVNVPLIGMAWEVAEPVAESFSTFIGALLAGGPGRPAAAELVGREVHELHPVALGGDPVDPRNKKVISRREHREVAAWWNRTIEKIKSGDVRGEQ